MQDVAVSPLTPWANFYVITGSSAAALTGLMFVVITLIAGSQTRSSGGSIGTFGTPNIVHFSLALLIAALLSAPWPALWNAGVLLILCGLGGMAYAIIVIRRARSQTTYTPVLEDWLWHGAFPLISYTAVLVAGIMLEFNPVPALFCVGAVILLLLFTGIHNAWDTVTYITFVLSKSKDPSQD